MNVPSNAISIFSLQAGDQSPDDAIVDVPNTLNVITELGTPHTFFAPSITRTPNGSFASYATIFKSNSAGTTSTNICTLSRGVWRIRYHLSFCCDYLDPAGLFAVFRINDLSGNVRAYLAQFPAMIGSFATDSTRMLMLTEESVLQLSSPGNGAGQTNAFAIGISGERVL